LTGGRTNRVIPAPEKSFRSTAGIRFPVIPRLDRGIRFLTFFSPQPNLQILNFQKYNFMLGCNHSWLNNLSSLKSDIRKAE
jgi:hypothetical protein